MSQTPADHSRFYYILGLAALAVHAAVIQHHAINMPKWDDYPSILQFMQHWLQASSLQEKLALLVASNNEHILLLNHLVVLAQYALIGHIDFSWLIAIGNGIYILSALVLWRCFYSEREKAFTFAVIMLAIVNFYSYDSLLWAMTSISNQAVILFALLALYYASREPVRLLPAILFTSLAVFSQSNGLLLLPAIGVYLYRRRATSAAATSCTAPWIIYSVFMVALYAWCFSLQAQESAGILEQLHLVPGVNYLLSVPGFIAFFGATLFPSASVTSVIAALLLGAAILWLFLRQCQQRLFPASLHPVFSFLLLCIVIIAAWRGLAAGISTPFISRYKMYSSYFLVTAVLLGPLAMQKVATSLRWRIGILTFAFAYYALAFPINLPQATRIDNDLRSSLQNWVEDGDLRRGRGFFIRDADSYLFAAHENGSYSPFALVDPAHVLRDVQVRTDCDTALAGSISSTDSPAPLEISHRNPNAIGIRLVTAFDWRDVTTPVSLLLCSPGHGYSVALVAPVDVASNPVFYIPREAIAPGDYRIAVAFSDRTVVLDRMFTKRANTR